MQNFLTIKNGLQGAVVLLAALLNPSAAAQPSTTSTEIVAFTPQGEVRRIQQVAVSFSADMVRLGESDAAAPVAVSCPQGNADTRDRIESTGSQVIFNTPAEFEARVRSDIDKWTRVARAANIKPN